MFHGHVQHQRTYHKEEIRARDVRVVVELLWKALSPEQSQIG
jgi:hypothetical protein